MQASTVLLGQKRSSAFFQWPPFCGYDLSACTCMRHLRMDDGVIDIEYNKRLDHQRPCLEGDLTAGSNL